MVNGFCVARSTNAGLDFTEVACQAISDSPASADRTAITVDGHGRVYVAQNTIVNGTPTGSEVWQSADVWNSFHQLPVPPIAARTEPYLSTDPFGDVWFSGRSGTGNAGEDINVSRWKQSDAGWDSAFSPSALCSSVGGSVEPTPMPPLAFRDVNYAGTRTFRNAHTYALQIQLDERNQTSMRGGFTLARDDGRQYIQFFEILGNQSVTKCDHSAGWSTEDYGGQQFQVSLDYHNRGTEVSTGGLGAVWWATYRSTQFVDETQAYVWTQAVQLQEGIANDFVLLFPQYVTLPATSFVCPRHETGEPDYYGDYIGVTQIRDTGGLWWGVAGYSYSFGAPPCDVQTPFLGRPTNVWSTRW